MAGVATLIPYQGKATLVVQGIVKKIVTDRYQERYNDEIILFMMWLIDSEALRESLLLD